ncbi:transferase [Trypanosoma conorhini]|uniref:Transferase n=1 Tax=Trypanosoma conorhini TaxID=83891 RepID=A0A3R7ME36_9TRYP|nr:transferase [Trypanosoma conorhini]RNF13556.1 transferase [Trypanosoma conorhini]
MSVKETLNRDGNSPLAPCWTYFDDEDCGDGVPRLSSDCSSHVLYGCAIGHGGDRGSLVYGVGETVNVPFSFGCPLALKIYPISITENELAFIRALFASDLTAFNNKGGSCGVCRQVPYLVLPLAIVTIGGVDRGILMPRHDYSLKQFLLATGPAVEVVGHGERGEDGADEKRFAASSLLSHRVFEPIRDCKVVTAIAFQLVVAISLLGEELPHVKDGILCRGFTHNDIHLDNILLNSESGCAALCDFELVGHISQDGEEIPPPALHRLPPYCRQSPHGLFSPTADTWALGLVVLSLLTGVDPLFDDAKLMDDFGDGPLLQSYTESEGTVPVPDWEGNIKAHVEALLLRDDPTGQRLADAGPLLELCAKCLVNRAGASPSVAVELLSQPLFSSHINSPQEAEFILKVWAESHRGAPPLKAARDGTESPESQPL